MRGLFLSFGLGAALLFSMFGCATGGVTVYSGASTGRISNVMYGQIIQADNVVLSDTGLGTVAGGVLGGVAGHQFGKGRGKTAMTIANWHNQTGNRSLCASILVARLPSPKRAGNTAWATAWR